MKTSEFKSHLQTNPGLELRFVLPDEDPHSPFTPISPEVGRIDKSFIDCGGTVRKVSNTTLQAWVADDTDHRLSPGQLAAILDLAQPVLGADDLDVEIEYEDCSITQFPVLTAKVEDGALVFGLGEKHTDCLAKDICLPQSAGSGCGTGGCC